MIMYWHDYEEHLYCSQKDPGLTINYMVPLTIFIHDILCALYLFSHLILKHFKVDTIITLILKIKKAKA